MICNKCLNKVEYDEAEFDGTYHICFECLNLTELKGGINNNEKSK